MNTLNAKLLLSAILLPALGTLGLSACDLEPKNIGDESESNSGSESDSDSDSESESESDTAGSASGTGTTGGGMCEPGTMMPADDGCNTCFCQDDASWACTEIGCEPTMCAPGDTKMEECNECFCDDAGQWACTDMACEPQACTPGDEQPDPDGCNTCSCDDTGQWACTDLACEPFDPFAGNGVGVCDDSVPMDSLVINSAVVDAEHQLTLTVSYAGGCTEHLFGGCWNAAWAESFPVQTSLTIAHDSMQDPCNAFPSEEVVVDLTTMVENYISSYGEGGSFILNLTGFGPIEISV